jgi:hypothetical protein
MKKKSILSQLCLQFWVSCTKYWLNFQEFPFSNRYQRPETRPDLASETKFPLLGHLTCISTLPELFSIPEAKVINLLGAQRILEHFPLEVGQHQLQSALGYPTRVWTEIGDVIGYPITPLSNSFPTSALRCASLGVFTGRWILRRAGVRFQCHQFVRVACSWG